MGGLNERVGIVGVREEVTANTKDHFLKLQGKNLFFIIVYSFVYNWEPEAVALHVCVVCMYAVACALKCVCGVYQQTSSFTTFLSEAELVAD